MSQPRIDAPCRTAWTTERVDKLKALWPTGMPASQIALALSSTPGPPVTADAVVAKRDRLGMRPRTPEVQQINAHGTSKAGGKAAVMFAGPGSAYSTHVKDPYRANVRAFSPLPGSSPLPWTERPSGGCSWPVGESEAGELLSCCLPIAKRGWCAAHAKLGLISAAVSKPPSANEMMRSLRRFAA